MKEKKSKIKEQRFLVNMMRREKSTLSERVPNANVEGKYLLRLDDRNEREKVRLMLGQDKRIEEDLKAAFAAEVNGQSANPVEQKCCPCGSDVILDSMRSELVCTQCGRASQFIDSTVSGVAFGESVEISCVAQKRIGHFKERLTFFQAREATRVPDEALIAVCKWLWDKLRIRQVSEIQLKDVHDAMRALRLRKYYKLRSQVFCRITGAAAPRLTKKQERQYLDNFAAMQEPFEKVCPKDRINFLSYSYSLYRLSELQGLTHYLPYFTLLRSKEKLRKQDRIFIPLAQELNWDLSKFDLLR